MLGHPHPHVSGIASILHIVRTHETGGNVKHIATLTVQAICAMKVSKRGTKLKNTFYLVPMACALNFELVSEDGGSAQ